MAKNNETTNPAEDENIKDVATPATPPPPTPAAKPTDFNPFEAPVKERAYTKSRVTASKIEDLPEPSFTPPSLEDFERAKESEATGSTPPPAPSMANPALEELPKKDQMLASEKMVDTVLDGYSKLHELGNKFIKVSNDKVQALHREGELDLNANIPYNERGEVISVADFFSEYNKQVDGVLEVSEEFKEKVKPPLIRVFQKRGVGMTDEQYLLYMFGTDIAEKSIMVFSLKRTVNQMINQMKELSGSSAAQNPKANRVRPEPAPAPDPSPTNPPPSPPPPPPAQEFSADDSSSSNYEELNLDRQSAESIPTQQSAPPQFGDVELLNHMENIGKKSRQSSSPKTSKSKK